MDLSIHQVKRKSLGVIVHGFGSGGNGTAGTCHGLPLHPQGPHQGGVSAAANVTGHVSVTSNDYDSVLNAIATKGPTAISVDASDWHDYESGVFNGGNSTHPDLDHLVQLVGESTTRQGLHLIRSSGYGTDTGEPYWIVRNSWTVSVLQVAEC